MRLERPDGYAIVDDPACVDVDRLHGWLDGADAYWWPDGVRRDQLETALAHSLPLVVLDPDGVMVGFGRVVSDRASFAYWCDVYIEREHRGRGLGRWLTSAFVEHPAFADCRRLLLATRDAHEVYAAVGFVPLPRPEIFLEIFRPSR